MYYKKLTLMKCMLAEWLHIGQLPTLPRKTYVVEWLERINSSIKLEVREYDSLWCALKNYWKMSRANSSVGLLLQYTGQEIYKGRMGKPKPEGIGVSRSHSYKKPKRRKTHLLPPLSRNHDF